MYLYFLSYFSPVIFSNRTQIRETGTRILNILLRPTSRNITNENIMQVRRNFSGPRHQPIPDIVSQPTALLNESPPRPAFLSVRDTTQNDRRDPTTASQRLSSLNAASRALYPIRHETPPWTANLHSILTTHLSHPYPSYRWCKPCSGLPIESVWGPSGPALRSWEDECSPPSFFVPFLLCNFELKLLLFILRFPLYICSSETILRFPLYICSSPKMSTTILQDQKTPVQIV